MAIDPKWKTSQRYIRIGHNKAVTSYFRTFKKNTTRESLRNSLLIFNQDSANQMLVKMQYFQQYLSGIKSDTVPVIPDSWAVKVPKGRPQLIVVFKPKNTNYSNPDSRWCLSIPHFNFTKTNLETQLKKIPSYEKGGYQGIYTLTDNSKIFVYAKSDTEARRFIKNLVTGNLIQKKYIPNGRISDRDIKVGEAKGTYKKVAVTPTYAKYFSTGQKNLNPDWTAFIDS